MLLNYNYIVYLSILYKMCMNYNTFFCIILFLAIVIYGLVIFPELILILYNSF